MKTFFLLLLFMLIASACSTDVNVPTPKTTPTINTIKSDSYEMGQDDHGSFPVLREPDSKRAAAFYLDSDEVCGYYTGDSTYGLYPMVKNSSSGWK